MSNSLDPDQARRFVGPDLGPNCLPRLLVDDTGRQRVKDSYNEVGTTNTVDPDQSNLIWICPVFPDLVIMVSTSS